MNQEEQEYLDQFTSDEIIRAGKKALLADYHREKEEERRIIYAGPLTPTERLDLTTERQKS